MPKEAISVTIEADNLVWLRGQVHAAGRKSVSDVLDSLVTEARTSGRVQHLSIRSVVGTIALVADDPDLAGADQALQALFPRKAKRTSRKLTARGGTPARTRKRGA